MSTTGTTIDLEQQMLGEVDDDVGVQHESHPIRYHIWWGGAEPGRAGAALRNSEEVGNRTHALLHGSSEVVLPRSRCAFRNRSRTTGRGAGPRGGEIGTRALPAEGRVTRARIRPPFPSEISWSGVVVARARSLGGYAFSRISTRSTARRIQYYRCIGSDRWRHLAGPRCDARPVRQDLLDEVVWTEVLRLLEEPALIQQELDRRLAAARAADPKRTRTQAGERDLARVGKTIGRLLTAYQEDLVSLDQLRERMPLLRQREQTLRQELNALVEQTRDRAAHLRLAETLSAFLTRLRASAETLDILERQRIVRLLVKEVLVSDDTIVIRHCIPVPSGPPPTGSGPNGHVGDLTDRPSYLLPSGSSSA